MHGSSDVCNGKAVFNCQFNKSYKTRHNVLHSTITKGCVCEHISGDICVFVFMIVIKALCRITFLPVILFLVETWMLTHTSQVRCVYELKLTTDTLVTPVFKAWLTLCMKTCVCSLICFTLPSPVHRCFYLQDHIRIDLSK